MPFTRHDYRVAWICALPLEMAAAKAILDEVHPPLAQPESDHNTYVLGSVGGHNVVVACLPDGVYGTISAAVVVSHLMSTYRNVRFGLMVGIGGGVPSDNVDIRLGDIVVSKPTDTSSGVVQYDYGKTLHNGQFYRTGSLNKPPSILLKAIAKMKSDYIIGQNLLSDIMSSTLQKEEVRNQFQRPLNDQLFQSTYNHISDSSNCSACDQNQLVDRPERTTETPHIHYGLIASGDQVMKDAKTRDLIAQDLDILCFEMEAAGIMDEIPSLVIRGVCDYCDSHKHKEWQAYAALVAAAYAKALLLQVPLHDQSAELKEPKHHWMVPFRKNPGFVGREEEIAKVEELFGKMNGPSKVAICGLGGVGKTQIALELAYRVRERDPTCSVFWIPCTSYASIEQAYMGIAQTIGIQEVKPADAKERVKGHLSQASGQKWLLIFDNADNMDMWVGGKAGVIELANYLPQSEEGHILFTTRNRKLAVRLASPFLVDISEPDIETSVKILEKALLQNDLLENSDATIALLEQLMFLPLAITQAAAYINSNNIKLSDYTVLLKEQEPDVIELLSEDFGDDWRYHETQNPVATTWLISFQQIQQSNPLAADYLSFMACINPRDIPQSLLPPAISKKKRHEAIGLLKAFAFVSEQDHDHALSLHRLVHLSTRNWLREHQQFHLQIQRTADQFDQVFPDNNHANQKLWRDYLPHALSLTGEMEFQEDLAKYIGLVKAIGRCLRTDGRYNEAAVLFEKLVSVQRNGNNDPDISTLISLADLASTYWHQGRWKEAEELEMQVLDIRKRVLGLEHPNTLTSMANLARSYASQGRWKKAEELEVQVLDIHKRVLGLEHPNTLTSIANLASTYADQGRWKEAEELKVRALNIRKRVLGLEHPNTLTSMANLARLYAAQGRWKEAEELEVQALNIRKRVLGLEHPDTLTSMANLAYTWNSRKKIHDALTLMEQCVKIQNRVLGPSHPSATSSACSLRMWKESLNLLTKEQHQSSRQAESDRPRDEALQECYPAAAINKPNRNEERIESYQGPVRSATPLRTFLNTHPLLDSQSDSPVLRGHDWT